MSEEEMKAVDYWKNYMEILHWNTQLASEHYMKVLLDLIEKQQIELNSLKEIEYKYNKALEDLVKLEKERQADKEKIKELEAINKRLRYTMNNAYLLDYIPRKEIEDKIDELTNSKEYFQMFPEDYLAKIGIEILEELLKEGGE